MIESSVILLTWLLVSLCYSSTMTMNGSLAATHKKLTWFSKPQPGHLVQFYQSDNNLLFPLMEFISSGLSRGDTCIVIATPSHVQSLNARLEKCDLDAAAAQLSRQYLTFDAAETLAKFMVNDLPDRDRFFDVVGALVENVAQKGKPIRAYGEMVALLWKVGNKDAVIQLENLWNELAAIHTFSLFCAYPELHFIMHSDMRHEIDECHNVNLHGLATG